MYDARVRFLVKSNRIPVLSVAGGENTPTVSDSQAAAQLATELQLLSAPAVLRAGALEIARIQGGGEGEAAIRSSIERIEKQTRVAPVLRSNLIEVQYTDPNPQAAVSVLQTMSTEYLNRHIGLRGGKENFEVFSRRAGDAALAVAKAQDELKKFQSKTGIVAIKEQRDVVIHSLAAANTALNETRAIEAEFAKRAGVLRAQIRSAPSRVNTTQRAVPNQFSVERLTTLLVELGNKRTDLLGKFRPDDRLVRQLDKQMEETRVALERSKSLISSEDTSDINPLRQQAEMELARTEQSLRGGRARAEALASQVTTHRDALQRLAAAAPRDADLTRHLREAEDNYAIYSKKRDQLRVDKLMDDQKIADVTLIEPPTLPWRPIPKVTATVVALYALLCGAVLFCVVVAGVFSRTFTRPAQLEKFSGVPVLGTLAANDLVRPATRRHYLHATVERIRAIYPEHGRGAAVFFVAGINARDDTFDALRLIASELAGTARGPVLVVPSSITMELNGAAMQLPIFEAKTGVAVALAPDMVGNGIQHKNWRGIPSSEFSYILVESPPLDGTQPLPPALRLAQGIFLVATAEDCLRSDVSRSMRFLRSTGCEPLGFVLRNRTYPIPELLYRYL